MRKITHPPRRHNGSAHPALIGPALLLALLLAGCGGGDERQAGRNADADNGKPCTVAVDTTAWAAFRSMADRMAAGTAVPEAERRAWVDTPVVTAWRQALPAPGARPELLAGWLQDAWLEELGLPRPRKSSGDRFLLGRGYRYCQEEAPVISARLAEFARTGAACTARDLAAAWIPAERMPTGLTMAFLPAVAELRYGDGIVFVDTGVLAAGPIDQLERQIATLLYRNFGVIPGGNPVAEDGRDAVFDALRIMVNEGVAAHLEQTTAIHFSDRHPGLRKVRIIPEEFFAKARETLEGLEGQLAPLLADPAAMTRGGRGFARALAGANAYTSTGLGMAAVISARLGEDELRRVSRSVPDFFDAYQRAALQNADPPPLPGTRGVELHESLPALPAPFFADLQAMLQAQAASR